MITIDRLRGIAQADDIAAQALADRAAGLASAADQWAQAQAAFEASTAEHARLMAELVTANATIRTTTDALAEMTARRDEWQAEARRLQGIIDAGVVTPPPGPPVEPPAPVPAPAPEPAPAPVPVPAPSPNPPAPAVIGRYRHLQRQLFQPGAPAVPSRIPGGPVWEFDRFGPTVDFVDPYAGWPWDRKGGDWVDAAGVRHGLQAWASVSTNAVAGSTASHRYTIDITALAQHVQAADRWLAIRLACAAPRAISGAAGSDPPVVTVVYDDDGTQATLPCSVTASLAGSSAYPTTVAPQIQLPALAEFDRPARPVRSASLEITITQHWSGPPVLSIMLVDPPINTQPQTGGIAQAAPLDAGLVDHPAVIWVQRILDGTKLHDFVAAPGEVKRGNFNALPAYDPAIYGLGPQDKTLLPHAAAGKWVGGGQGWSLVGSDYTGEGFKPLAPGVAAIRLERGQESTHDGEVVGYATNSPINAKLFMPDEDFGLLDEIYVRYHLRIGTPDGQPMVNDLATRYLVKCSPTDQLRWTDCAGKVGMMPAHDTTEGGVSGTSGGGGGWQIRDGWQEMDLPAGPSVGGWGFSPHLYDFQAANPQGHRYGAGQGLAVGDRSYGQIGGMGGLVYAHQWVAIETRIKLNSVKTLGADGRYWQADGVLQRWVDDRLVYSKEGMVFRSLPLRSIVPKDPAIYLPPVRELGIRDIWLNWFHGGLTKSSRARVLFFTGFACGRERLGAMRLT